MKQISLSRRNFLRLALLGGIGAGAVYIHNQTGNLGLINFLRWSLRGQLQKLRPAALVGLAKCPSYDGDLLSYLQNLWEISAMPDIKGKSIFVKPNLVDESEDYIATVNPKLVGAVLDLLRAHNAGSVVVGDGSAFRRDTFSVARSCGLLEELDRRGVPFIDLNYDELKATRIRDGWIRGTDTLWLPQHVAGADLIVSIPKLKTHHWAGVTLSLKNLIGVIPGSRYGWPKNFVHINGINATILGIYQSLPPIVSIVDGIVGMEGNGPLFGKPVEHGLLAMGRDPVAVDIICTQLMGFSIDSVPYLGGAMIAGIGQGQKIETRGVPRDQLQKHYEAPPTI